MLCGILRHQGTPARVRCRFASYFTANPWEDHWICEYWSNVDRHWRRADAQLDDTMKQRLGVSFDSTILPTGKFMTAGEAWRACRESGFEPKQFGHGTARGLWFSRVNVVRDHYALSQSEVSDWDSWRRAVGGHERLSNGEIELADLLAHEPEQASKHSVRPPWRGVMGHLHDQIFYADRTAPQ